MGNSNEEMREIERAEWSVARFNASDMATNVRDGYALEANLEQHGGGDFTISVGMDDGRDEPWPVTVHAVYNSVDEFESWAQKLDGLDTEGRKQMLAEDLSDYQEAVAAGHGDWNRGKIILSHKTKQNGNPTA